MLFILSKIFSILIFTASVSAADQLTCEKGQLRSVTAGQTEITHSSYCYDSTKTQLLSENCKAKRCTAFVSSTKINPQDLVGPVGNPSFKICRKVGGHPEIIEFQAQEKWYKLDRCLFPNGSYADASSLAGYYLNGRK